MPETQWLTRYGPEGASSRYRAYQLADGLGRRGWACRFDPMTEWRSPPSRQIPGIARRFGRLRTSDPDAAIQVVQKEPIMPPVLHPLIAGALRSSEVPIVWDIDDAVWLGRRGSHAMAVGMCRAADHVVVGNRLLGEWADRHGARQVTVVPTCFDRPLGPTPAEPHDLGGRPRVVWIGSPATAPLVEPFGEMLRLALESLPEMTIEFVGGPPPAELIGHDRVVVTDWSPEAEAQALTAADFGLALQDRGEYADHKCGFKIVQYLAYGVVPLASDGPVHRDIVGGHGLLLGAPTDRGEVVERLAAPPTAAERSTILDYHREAFSVERAVDSWADVLAAADRRRHRTG